MTAESEAALNLKYTGKCDHDAKDMVIDSQGYCVGNGTRKRRRQCLICGARWSTVEISRERYKTLLKAEKFHKLMDNHK